MSLRELAYEAGIIKGLLTGRTVCDQCGKEFYRAPHKKKDHKNFFCSRECHQKWQQKPNFICEYCGNPFYAKTKSRKNVRKLFCSDKCRLVFRATRRDRIGSRKCPKCGEWKPRTSQHYSKNAKAPKGFEYKCKECTTKHNRERDLNRNAFEYAYKNRKTGTKSLNNKKRKSNHLNNKPILEWNLTYEQALTQLEKQDYKCYYTGRKLSPIRLPYSNHIHRHNYNPSIDRLDSTKGYTPNNIAWTISAVNFMKGELPEKEFLSIATEIHNHTKKSET